MGEKRLVFCGRGLRGQPERVRVRLVPDHDVTNLAVAEQDVADEAAVVLTGRGIMRCVGSSAEDPEHGPYAVTIRGDRASESIVIGASQVALARTPFERYAHASETERLHRAEDRRRSFCPLDAVVVHSNQEVGAGARRTRPDEQGKKEERERRSDSHLLSSSAADRHAQSPERRVWDRRGRRFP